MFAMVKLEILFPAYPESASNLFYKNEMNTYLRYVFLGLQDSAKYINFKR